MSDRDVDDIVSYIDASRSGRTGEPRLLALGQTGPFAEGFLGWLVASLLLLGATRLIGGSLQH